ncbi:MAG: G1 family endopeptidase [Pseudonocardia sp.]|nr:G1 family endopeptidase [Pseudonocardia sp.]
MRRPDGNPTGGVRIRGLLVSALGVATLLIAPGAAGAGASADSPVRTSSSSALPADRAPEPPPSDNVSEDGGNWSGYVATGKDFRSVSARWTEPAVTCGSTSEKFAPWVGIDGYGSGTVQQTGVATDCSSGKPVYRAWYETVPEPPVYYPLPVQAGDEITAEVSRSGSTYTMTISDVTRNWTRSVSKTHPEADNLSAEVALEWQDGGFPKFGAVTFTEATVNGKPLSSAKPTAIDATDTRGFLTDTGPLTGGGFTIRDLGK